MSWNYKEIKMRQRVLDKNSPFYKDDLENLKEMLKELGKESLSEKILSPLSFFTSKFAVIEDNLSHYRSLANLTNPILLKAFAVTKDYDVPELQKRLPKKNFEIKDYMEMIDEFAQTLPEPFKTEVRKYANESYFQISSTIDAEYNGITFIIHSPSYKPYYLIKKTKSIEIFVSMIHEIGHGIFLKNEKTELNLYKLLDEVEGYFFDYLALEFLKKKGLISQKDVLENDCFTDFVNSLYQYFAQALHLHLIFQKKGFVSTEEILKESFTYDLSVPLSQSYLEFVSALDFFENAKYAFSYLVNLDLQNISDLEKALYYLYKLRSDSSLEIHALLKKWQITFLEDNYASLKRVKREHIKMDKQEKI